MVAKRDNSSKKQPTMAHYCWSPSDIISIVPEQYIEQLFIFRTLPWIILRYPNSKFSFSMSIVILTLQPILKLPQLWNAKYLGLSYSIILQIVWVVPSILSLIIQVTWPSGHMTIAAIFDNGKNSFLYKFWYVLKNQSVMVTSSVVCRYCYVIMKP